MPLTTQPVADNTQNVHVNYDSPLTLEAAQQALILQHAHLSERLPKLTEAAARATKELRETKRELNEITRTLRHMERVKTPRRRRG